LANHCALGDNKHPQDLVSATVCKIGMEKQLPTPMVTETTTSSIKLPMERQMGMVQTPKLVSFRRSTMGTTTNKAEAQEMTDQTTSRTTMASLVMPATNRGTQPEIVHSSREETTMTSKMITDRRIFSKERKVPKEIRRKTQNTMKVTI